MYNSERAVLLFDAKPPRSIRGIGGLINAGSNLLLEEVDNFVEDACRDGNVLVDPGCVCDGGNFDR